jgi:predicted acyl esterase
VWRPLTDEPVPALLEYLPYRLTDWTAPRDRQRHPWYAGHGYASVRVDVRGHGNSEGLPGDEYSATELADGVEVVNWLAAQPWCSGKVGMFGISWGGFNSLQIAALAPEPLKAVVTVCSTDDRYDNDVHYMGGSVLAVDMHAWAATMLAFVSRPPDPLYVGRGLARPVGQTAGDRRSVPAHLAGAPDEGRPLAPRQRVRGLPGDPGGGTRGRRLARPVPGRGPAPRGTPPGGPRTGDHRAVVAPVPRPGAATRPGDRLPPGDAAVVGPLAQGHGHDTDTDTDTDTGIMSEPLLRSYVSDSHPPATVYPALPGRWVGDPAWPSPLVAPVTYALRGEPVVVRSPQHTGLDAGRFFPFGNDADLPPDQRDEDAKSACFDFEVPEEIWVLGRPRVRLRLTTEATRGQVVARICDVAPDGSSTLVTRGVLNLSARHGRDQVIPWKPGSTEDVILDLNAIGHAFPPGHRIRLAVSSAYWPWIWPQPGSEAGFTLTPSGSVLELPLRAQESDPSISFGEPEQAEPMGVNFPATLDEPRPERLVVHDVAKGEWRLEVDPRYGGTRVYPDGLEFTEEALDTYTIDESDPLSARARSDWFIRLHRPDLPWDASVESHSETTCDEADFITVNEVICRDGDEVVFHRTWEKRIPRTAG